MGHWWEIAIPGQPGQPPKPRAVAYYRHSAQDRQEQSIPIQQDQVRDRHVREESFDAACQAAAALMRDGQVVVSPVCHSHPIARYGLPMDWSFWERIDRRFLEMCDEVVVLTIPGWGESLGVQAEIRIARELGKPIRYLNPVG